MLQSDDALIRAGRGAQLLQRRAATRNRAPRCSSSRHPTPEPTVRARAWESLADATTEAAIREAMIAVLNDESKPIEERGGAAVGLYGVADRDDVRRGIEALYEAGGTARVKALEAMWRSLWPDMRSIFPAHLDDPDPKIVREALRGAGYFELTRYADKIAKYFDREEPFRSSARRCAVRLCARHAGRNDPRARARDAAEDRFDYAADVI